MNLQLNELLGAGLWLELPGHRRQAALPCHTLFCLTFCVFQAHSVGSRWPRAETSEIKNQNEYFILQVVLFRDFFTATKGWLTDALSFHGNTDYPTTCICYSLPFSYSRPHKGQRFCFRLPLSNDQYLLSPKLNSGLCIGEARETEHSSKSICVFVNANLGQWVTWWGLFYGYLEWRKVQEDIQEIMRLEKDCEEKRISQDQTTKLANMSYRVKKLCSQL